MTSSIMNEFNNSPSRMAQAIDLLRTHAHETTLAQKGNVEEITSLKMQSREQSRILAEQEQEIANHSIRAEETKALLQALQGKYLKAVEDLNTVSAKRGEEAIAHSNYVEHMLLQIIPAIAATERLAGLQKQINALVSENNRLVKIANSKRVFSLSRIHAPISERFRFRLPHIAR